MTFKPGNNANPTGRPKGSKGKSVVELRLAVLEALNAEGGVEYLRRLSRQKPEVFGSLLSKCIPSKIEADVHTWTSLTLEQMQIIDAAFRIVSDSKAIDATASALPAPDDTTLENASQEAEAIDKSGEL